MTCRSLAVLAASAMVMVSLAGCAGERPPEGQGPETERAVAVLEPIGDSSVSGTVTFSKVPDGILIVAEIEGLPPGKHGFHIHQYGDLTVPDGTSAGGHFNPENAAHGGPDAAERHVGDLGNIVADEQGRARYERTDRHLSIGGAHSIVGRAVVVHAGEDDLASQPSGAAGARVAWGVIGIAEGTHRPAEEDFGAAAGANGEGR